MPPSPPRAWQRMLSGRRLNLLDPSPLDIELSDIAHGLARVARWNGQTIGDYAYSVAQHSLLVMEIAAASGPKLDASGRLYALLHDAPEYVMGDIISPFKTAMGGNYKEVENRLLGAIHMRFSLAPSPPPALKRALKRADRQAAYFEAVELAGFDRDEAARIFVAPRIAGFDIDGFDELMRPWPTGQAHMRYLAALEANISA
ncbi:MAG: HD family hydrolase [Alphaproteobacteria bacterium]|nr:HD family hydrolase [Alphaproteobacteria bacterium]